MKPQYTEREIDELNDLNRLTGYTIATVDVLSILKELGYSNVHSTTIALRKKMNERFNELKKQMDEEYPNSTLIDTLSNRIDYNEKYGTE